MARDGRGWHKESARHGLAAKGVKTARPGQLRRKAALVGLIEDQLRDRDKTLETFEKVREKYARTRGRFKDEVLFEMEDASIALDIASERLRKLFRDIDALSDLPPPTFYAKNPRGVQRIYRFDGDWGVSVIMNQMSRGGQRGLYELIPIRWWGKGDDEWEIPPRAREVGWLTDSGVRKELDAIRKVA